MSTAHNIDRLRNAELGKIHEGKRQLRLQDADYRYIVLQISADFRETPVDSAGEMTSAERKALIQEMQRRGAQFGPPKGEKPMFGDSNEPHVRKLYACAYQLVC